MTSARRVLVLVVTLVLGTTATAYALRPDSPGRTPQAVQSAHRYWAHGPTAEYGSDYGAIGTVHPLRVDVPDGTYDAVVTVSFEYRTHGPGPFEIGLDARHVDVRPGQHPLPATGWTPMTVRFLLPALDGGRGYELTPFPNTTTRAQGENRITTRRALMTVDLTPVG